MFTKTNKIKKIAVITTAVAAIGAPAAFAQTDGGLLTEAKRQITPSYAGMATDGALLTRASDGYEAPQALQSSYAGMVTDGALLTAAAQKAQPLSR